MTSLTMRYQDILYSLGEPLRHPKSNSFSRTCGSAALPKSTAAGEGARATESRVRNHWVCFRIRRIFLFPCRTATTVGAAQQGSQAECLDTSLGMSGG